MLLGVQLYNIKPNIDERGNFSEVFRQDWINDKIVQVNVSKSHPNVVRAWHRHLQGQIDYITILNGTAKICIYDETSHELNEFILNNEVPQLIRIPGFYWHGTKCIGNEPSTTLYLMTKLYDDSNPDEERVSSIIDPRTNKPYDWNKVLL